MYVKMPERMDDKKYYLPFDLFQRYEVCQNILKKLIDKQKDECSYILDMGGRDGGLFGEYLTEIPVIVADTHILALKSDLLYIRTDALRTPFSNKSIDITICLDTFEHIPKDAREDFVREFERITCQLILCSFPFKSPENEYIENLLHNIVRSIQEREDLFLLQHINNGLPTENDFTGPLVKDAKQICSFGCDNVYLWFLMSVLKKMYSFYGYGYFYTDISREMDYLYNRFLSSSDHSAPFYRVFIIVSFIHTLPTDIASICNAGENRSIMVVPDKTLPLFALNYGMSALKADADHIRNLERLMKEYSGHFQDFLTIIKEKDECIEYLRKENNQLINNFIYYCIIYIKNKIKIITKLFKKGTS